MATTAEMRGTERLRPGWLHGYSTMTHWELADLRLTLPLMVVIQVLAGAGFVLGIGLFFRHIPPTTALYVSTGVPVVNLVLIGLIFGPQVVAEQKLKGTYDYLRALPVPRSSAALAWFTVTLLAGIPAVLVSLLMAEARYDFTYTITLSIIPACLLTAFTGTMLGYALSHAIRNPMTTRLITQLLVFVVMGFSPIMYPASQLPDWLAAVNRWLPFEHMAVIVRAGLTAGLVDEVGRSYVIVAIWGVLGAAFAARALGRRG